MKTKIINQVSVCNMYSLRSNKPVPNQYTIWTPEGKYFQSYNAIIAHITTSGEIYLDAHYWNWSRTTTKYLNQFLGTDTTALKQNIKDGTYTLTHLNR